MAHGDDSKMGGLEAAEVVKRISAELMDLFERNEISVYRCELLLAALLIEITEQGNISLKRTIDHAIAIADFSDKVCDEKANLNTDH